MPLKPTTEAGRNCALFVALMKWAGSPANIGREVVAVARATNDGLDVPLGDSEVAGLAKSVERYRRSWIAKGRFYTEAEREAWGCALGLRSGLARRKGSNEELRLWEAEGISPCNGGIGGVGRVMLLGSLPGTRASGKTLESMPS